MTLYIRNVTTIEVVAVVIHVHDIPLVMSKVTSACPIFTVTLHILYRKVSCNCVV